MHDSVMGVLRSTSQLGDGPEHKQLQVLVVWCFLFLVLVCQFSVGTDFRHANFKLVLPSNVFSSDEGQDRARVGRGC
jgi:hypothetical protein